MFKTSSLSLDKDTMPALALPEPDATQLTHSPLEVVVCQVRHEKRLIVSEGATALAAHEALGGPNGRYANLDEVTGGEVNVVMGPSPNVSETRTSGWRFASDDGAWVVTLMPDHFALETSAYTTWTDDFRPRLGELVDAVAEHVAPTFERRIGLRYIDRIAELGLTDLGSWQRYLRPEMLGLILHPELGPGVRASQQQTVLELDDGVSAGLRHGPVVEDGRDAVDYQLDFDVFRQGSRAFDAEELKAVADQFNIYALQLFQASVTEDLLEALR